MLQKMNEHKDMELKSIWFKEGEYNKLVNAIENNNKDEAFNIIFWMNHRGDLK